MKRFYDYKKFLMLAVGTIALVSFGQAAHAAQGDGSNEILLGGGFVHAEGTEVGTLNVDLSYGYFLTRSWELGVTQTLGYNFIDDGEDTWTASTVPFVQYHFLGLSANDAFQPFIGAFVGAAYNEDDVTGTAGPIIGFKNFLDDNTFITVKYRYEWYFDDLEYDDVTDTADGNHVATLGLGFIW